MYHDERNFREDERGHHEATQVSIPKDVSANLCNEKTINVDFRQ